MPGPILNARIYANKNNASTRSFTIPAWFVLMKLPSVMMSTGDYPLVLHKRIADELGIQDEDTIQFELFEFGQEYSYPVKVLENINGDFLIHDAFAFPGLLASNAQIMMDSQGTHIASPITGAKFCLPNQDVFSGMKIVKKQGTCELYFDGGSRNNPRGPAGWGYVILDEDGEWLVKAYGFKAGSHSSNYMEYQGLLEGMIWANRLDPKTIEAHGDSELIINQVIGQYQVNNPKLQQCRDAFQSLSEKIGKQGTNVSVQWTPRDQNSEADKLANKAMDRKESKIVVNWENVRSFMSN